ncbi:MAG: DUF192 domain-containing protein [Fusobacteriaceae bacterium]
MDNATRRELLNKAKSVGYTGNILDVFSAHEQGRDLIGEFMQSQQPQVAITPEEQQQGLRPAHAAGNTNQSMVFPNVQPNQSFNTVGMKAPIDINKIDNQGNLVESYKSVPPGIQNLPTGPYAGTVIESPAKSYASGGPNIGGIPMPTLPQEEPAQEPTPEPPQEPMQPPQVQQHMETSPMAMGSHLTPFMSKGQSGELYYDPTSKIEAPQPEDTTVKQYFIGGLKNRVRYNKAKYKR